MELSDISFRHVWAGLIKGDVQTLFRTRRCISALRYFEDESLQTYNSC